MKKFTYLLVPGGIQCGICNRISYNQNDVRNLYCAHCNRFHGDSAMAQTEDTSLERCQYELAVEKYFGLPTTVQQSDKIDVDFGMLVDFAQFILNQNIQK